jgi:hypothetical protein
VMSVPYAEGRVCNDANTHIMETMGLFFQQVIGLCPHACKRRS